MKVTMPKIKYQDFNFGPATLRVIDQANAILNEYSARGYVVTLRQLYYQFVSRDLIANKQSEYKRLGSIINDARLAGLIDWDHLQDRTRNLQSLSHWTNPGHIIESAASGYHIDLWQGQPAHVEIWIEKDALVGVIENVCERWDVAYFSCRGYTSQSEMWAAGRRLAQIERRTGRETHVIHLGDHDPSGKDMSRDIQDRLRLFGANTQVERIALNMNQVEQYNPPPNPAKITDSRAAAYIEEYGDESWELDALNPEVLEDLIESAIKARVDEVQFESMKDAQERDRASLTMVANHWDEAVSYVRDNHEDED